jgi:RNA polymerase sigma factor for flagellar operon FliA
MQNRIMRAVTLYTRVEEDLGIDVILKFGVLVKRIAHHLMGRLPDSVQVDDLIQAGMIGLLEAAKNFDTDKGASFETYAGIRIRGSMLDEIRKGDWVPRSVHRNTRRIVQAIREVENARGRDARDQEVAEKLELRLDEYHDMLKDMNSVRIFSLEELGVTEEMLVDATNDHQNPLEGVQIDNFKTLLEKGLSGLPERERLVLALYYNEELNLREVGAVLGVSESRISQLHSQAMLRLQARLQSWSI